MLASKLLMTVGGEEKLYSDEVFSAYTRAGTGADTTVTTGIDMTKGYMLWSKGRSGATDHAIYDSARGVTFDLVCNANNAQTTQTTGLKSVSTTGHTVGSLAKMNTSAATYVDWVFRKAPKFFDVVTFNSTGTNANRRITHSLGATPGMIIVKNLANNGSNWYVWHRSFSNPTNSQALLNSTNTVLDTVTQWGSTGPTSSDFGFNEQLQFTGNYVVYLFAHDTSADGIVQCGSFTTDGSGNVMVNLGWEPQYLMIKNTTTSEDWFVFDQSRGWPTGSNALILRSNTNGAESNYGGLYLNQLGFSGVFAPTQTYIYLAIRRPNKPPTLGTQVYNAIARTGTGAAATVTGVGFAPDLCITKKRSSTTLTGARFTDRLRGKTIHLDSTATTAEVTTADTVSGFDVMDGFVLGADATTSAFNTSGHTYINHFFKRAPGVFDVVCYTGTGVAKTEAHGLGVVPELIIVKSRSAATEGEVYLSSLGNDKSLNLFFSGGGAAFTTSGLAWNYTTPTATAFSLGTWDKVNGASVTFVAYLFATKAGISKVFSYTGNGTSQTLDMGFTTGARFFLVKSTSTTGNWWVYDATRGIVSSTDFALALNSTAAEVTSADAVDPNVSGIIVNQEATCSINASGVSYIYLAYA